MGWLTKIMIQIKENPRGQFLDSAILKERIVVVQGNLLEQKVDVVVNPSNSLSSDLRLGNGSFKPFKTSEAKITTSDNFFHRYVIHTCAPLWIKDYQEETEKQLAGCYRNCLNLAEEKQIKTIAFPCIGTLIKGYPKYLSAKIAVQEVRNFLKENAFLSKVIFVCQDEMDYKRYSGQLLAQGGGEDFSSVISQKLLEKSLHNILTSLSIR